MNKQTRCTAVAGWITGAWLLFGAIEARSDTVAYQFYPDKTSPRTAGWEYYPYYGTETLLKHALQITDTSSAKDGYYYKTNFAFTAYNSFQARVRFRFVACGLPPSPVHEHAFLLGIANGTKDYGRFIKLGMVQTEAGTKIGFVNTNGLFFGNAYTSSSPDFIEVEVSKPLGNGAALSVRVDGVTTPISVAANTNEFPILGNQTYRYLTFGMYGFSATGVVQVVGCTGGTSEDAPPIVLPPTGTALIIR